MDKKILKSVPAITYSIYKNFIIHSSAAYVFRKTFKTGFSLSFHSRLNCSPILVSLSFSPYVIDIALAICSLEYQPIRSNPSFLIYGKLLRRQSYYDALPTMGLSGVSLRPTSCSVWALVCDCFIKLVGLFNENYSLSPIPVFRLGTTVQQNRDSTQ